jgi:hypothetical protein
MQKPLSVRRCVEAPARHPNEEGWIAKSPRRQELRRSPTRVAGDRKAVAFWSSLFAAVLVTLLLGVDGGAAHAETMTCLGACRVEYGACLMEAKDMDPPAASAHRTECGKGYLRCSKKCKEATP